MPVSNSSSSSSALQFIQQLVGSIMNDVEVTEDPMTRIISIRDLVGSGEQLELTPERVQLSNGELPLPARTRIVAYLASRQS